MGTKYQRLLRRIKALEQMYKFSDEEKAIHRDLTWDLICDIILCPTGGDGNREMLTNYQKGKLLYLLATGEELEEGKDDED